MEKQTSIENDILTTIFANDEWRVELLRGLDDDDFQNPLLRGIFSSCKQAFQRGEDIDAAVIFLALNDKIKRVVPEAQKAFSAILDGPTVCDPAYAINELRAERRRRRVLELGNAISKSAECGEVAKAEDLAHEILTIDCPP